MPIFEALGYVLILAPIFFLTPQLARTVKTQNIEGISVTSQISWVFSWITWSLYGLYVGSAPVFLNNFIGFIADAILLVLLFKIALKSRTVKDILKEEGNHTLVLFLAIPIVATYLIFGFDVAIILIAIADFFILLPQFLITLGKKSLTGLSFWTWLMKVLVGLGWIVYGIGIEAPLSVGWAFLMTPLQIIILARILHDRHKISK